MEKPNYSQIFAVTLTLLPKIYKLTPQRQYLKGLRQILGLFKRHGVICNTLVPELTKNYNVHFHGAVYLPLLGKQGPKEKWYNIFRQDDVVGFTLIKEVEDYGKWEEYMYKNLEETRTVLRKGSLIWQWKPENEEEIIDYIEQQYKSTKKKPSGFDSSDGVDTSFAEKEYLLQSEVKSAKASEPPSSLDNTGPVSEPHLRTT